MSCTVATLKCVHFSTSTIHKPQTVFCMHFFGDLHSISNGCHWVHGVACGKFIRQFCFQQLHIRLRWKRGTRFQRPDKQRHQALHSFSIIILNQPRPMFPGVINGAAGNLHSILRCRIPRRQLNPSIPFIKFCAICNGWVVCLIAIFHWIQLGKPFCHFQPRAQQKSLIGTYQTINVNQ